MPDILTNDKRLAKNTLVLYVRMLFTVGISFYTTRVVLVNLGIDNYGLYNVVGSVVSFSYIITTTLTDAVTRFITVDIGRGDLRLAKETFSTSVNILLLSSLIIVLIFESIGLWFVNNQLVYDINRTASVNWIYQFFIITILIEIMSVPFSALIIAYEKMSTFAFITVSEVFLKLVVAFALAWSPIDRLIYFGLLMCLVSVIRQILYVVYCIRRFEECSYTFQFRNIAVFKPMAKYASLKILSVSSCMASTAGLGVVLNMFFPAYVNAARGIAMQIQGQSTSFARNFMLALNPQIIKTYARGDVQETIKLVYMGSRIAFFLFFIVGLPILLEADYILSIWLKEVPSYSVIFVQLAMITQMVAQIFSTFGTLNNAIGHIRKFEIQYFLVTFFTLPLSYLFVWLGFSPVCVPVIYLLSIIGTIYPCFFANKKYIKLPIGQFLSEVLLRILVVSALSFLVVLPFRMFMQASILRLLITIMLSILASSFFIIFIGLYPEERLKLKIYVVNRIKKLD